MTEELGSGEAPREFINLLKGIVHVGERNYVVIKFLRYTLTSYYGDDDLPREKKERYGVFMDQVLGYTSGTESWPKSNLQKLRISDDYRVLQESESGGIKKRPRKWSWKDWS